MVTPTVASSTKSCMNKLDMEDIAWTVQPIEMDLTVNDAEKITICVKMVTAYLANVTVQALGIFSATLKANVSVNQELLARNVIDVS